MAVNEDPESPYWDAGEMYPIADTGIALWVPLESPLFTAAFLRFGGRKEITVQEFLDLIDQENSID